MRWSVTGGAPQLRPAARRAADRAVALGADHHRREGIELAVHELLANALEHGHVGDPELAIEVEVVRAPQGPVRVRVTDRARGGAWTGPPRPRGTADTTARGRGWQLVSDIATAHRVTAGATATVVDITLPTT